MTEFQRIEGSNVDPETTEGLAARVADPLWYLARQWQVGEFRGEDAASPVIVDAEIEIFPITEVRLRDGGPEDTLDYKPATGPLEPLIEAEATSDALTAWDRLKSAFRLLRRLDAIVPDLDVLAPLQNAYPFPQADLRSDSDDPLGAARLALLARRGFDTRVLIAECLYNEEEFAKAKFLAELEPGAIPLVLEALAAWYAGEIQFAVTRPDKSRSAWIDRRQEYTFEVSTGSLNADGAEIVLTAPDHNGGRLDWNQFDLAARPEHLRNGVRQDVQALVSPLRFAGQPAQRFWEIEEGQVYFGDLQGGASDLNRSIIGAYAAVAGDDWFVLPARVPRGHIARITRMRVLSNFSRGWIPIPATFQTDTDTDSDRVWRFFEHHTDDEFLKKLEPVLFVPPVIATAEVGPPIEEVHLRRDELANLVWAIERRSQRPSGRVVETTHPVRTAPYQPVIEGDWVFQLGKDVPDHWFPLVPVRLKDQNGEVVLRRGQVLDGVETVPPEAKGRLLTPERPFYLEESEVPHGGSKVTRRWRYTRGADGSRHLWVGRRKTPSSGEMSKSPLGFDVLSGWPATQKRG